ncbi:MAG TPA: di-trans,poly-cis-decaprenylcistransferase [Candidatus Thorarchaeota archaeon]|nr:MAG: di-trans,poly-cis-decaprenylcistransferase [Candidatus Thorarchaeota archaeon]HDD67183.1 di-trans,poly-cis-decaprenylcistransferase [Candidatus Thorarchaeota archaeon]
MYRLYEYVLYRQLNKERAPRHVGIILDGNRRYAREHGLDVPWFGHRLGAQKVMEVLRILWEAGVKVCTLYTFSIENFQRNEREVREIMEIAKEKFTEVVNNPDVHRHRVKINAIGRVDLLPPDVQDAIRLAEESTAHYSDHILNVAIGYSGRTELVDAVREIARKVEAGELSHADIDESVIEEHLYTRGIPDPDLIIRTSGEERLSGFLLWQSAYSELYFAQIYWPAVRRIDIWRALRSYERRSRRFGK